MGDNITASVGQQLTPMDKYMQIVLAQMGLSPQQAPNQGLPDLSKLIAPPGGIHRDINGNVMDQAHPSPSPGLDMAHGHDAANPGQAPFFLPPLSGVAALASQGPNANNQWASLTGQIPQRLNDAYTRGQHASQLAHGQVGGPAAAGVLDPNTNAVINAAGTEMPDVNQHPGFYPAAGGGLERNMGGGVFQQMSGMIKPPTATPKPKSPTDGLNVAKNFSPTGTYPKGQTNPWINYFTGQQ